jgi:hypothetical protein
LIVTGLAISFITESTPDEALFWVGNSSCSNDLVDIGDFEQVPVSPGIAIPASDRLCARSGEGENETMVSGYSVTSSTVSAPHTSHAIPNLQHP